MVDDWERSRAEVAEYQVRQEVTMIMMGSACLSCAVGNTEGLQGQVAARPDIMSTRDAAAGCPTERQHRQHPASLPQHEHPDSILAANIAACCAFRAGGPSAALQSLGTLPAQLPPGGGSQGGALVLHNAVVFGDGAGGMQVRVAPDIP